MKRISLVLALLLVWSVQAEAGLIFEFDPADLSAVSTGSNQSFAVDLLIENTDAVPASLSGFTIDVLDPGVGLTISEPATSSYVFDLGAPSVAYFDGKYGIGAFGSTGNVIPVGISTLVTVQFNLDGSITDHVFPLDLTVTEAFEDLFTPIVGAQATDSSFEVTAAAAVPEPSTCLLFFTGIAGCAIFLRRQDDRSQSHR